MGGYLPHIVNSYFVDLHCTWRCWRNTTDSQLSDRCVVPGVTSCSVGASVGARGRTAMWAFPTSPLRGDCCLGVETCFG
jgi:hypothetical protein